MNWAGFDAFVFDMDGTLLDSAGQIMSCLQEAFDQAGVSADKTLFSARRVGPPVSQIVAGIAPDLPADKQKEIISHFRRLYDFAENDSSRLYPGVSVFLNWLVQHDKAVFVATFKPQKPTLRIVSQLGLSCFKDVYTPDKYAEPMTKGQMISHIVEKYGLNKQTTIMFGDSLSDIKAAREAGVKAAACLWGYGQEKEEMAHLSDFVFTTSEELLK